MTAARGSRLEIGVAGFLINQRARNTPLPVTATIDIDSLRRFVAVVQAGSFTAAAQVLGTQKAHLSRVVSRLERNLGVRLLHRTTRSLTLTEEGRELHERARTILAVVEDTEAAMQRARGEPQGLLRLTCSVEFGALAVTDWIGSFLSLYRSVRVEADYTSRLVDIVHEGFDLAIRVGQLEDSSLSARRLGEIRYGFYASPSYIGKRGEPLNLEELAFHDLVLFAPSRPLQRLEVTRGTDLVDVDVEPRLVANSNLAARQATVAGVGLAVLPTIEADPYVERGLLKPVLLGWSRPPVPVHAVFASGRYLAPKVRAFIDHAHRSFAGAVA